MVPALTRLIMMITILKVVNGVAASAIASAVRGWLVSHLLGQGFTL